MPFPAGPSWSTVQPGITSDRWGTARVTRSAQCHQAEADQLRARGWTYREIAAEWKRRHGFNSRVAFRLAHGLTQAEVAARWNAQWPEAECLKTAKQISYWEIWPAPGGRTPSVQVLNKR